MKPHLIIKLRQPFTSGHVPFWGDFIRNKSGAVLQFNNEIDRILGDSGHPFWVTQEYKPERGAVFSGDEITAGLNRIYRVILQNNADLPPAVLNRIRVVPIVEDVRPIMVGEAELPVQAASLGLDTVYDKARNAIYLREAHAFSKGSPSIKVAVLDTGADLTHSEIKDSISAGADFVNLEGLDTTQFIGDILGPDSKPDDECGHGTHVSGIVAGKGIKMPVGVVPRCKLMVVRVLATMKQGDKKVGAGLIDNINTGIKWAVDNGADVINMSLGVRHEHGGLPHEEVVKYALGKGVTIVAASGNDGTDDKYYPGALPGVIAVGAVDEEDRTAPFSNFGRQLSLTAPGSNIHSSFVNGTYAMCSGTSQAAPFVSGAIALLKSFALEKGIRLRDNQVKHLLKHTSDKPGRSFRTERSGYGRINLIDSLKLLQYTT
jgi:thermitase